MMKKITAAILALMMVCMVITPYSVLAEDFPADLSEEAYADLGTTPVFDFLTARPHSPATSLKVVTRDGEEAWSTNKSGNLYVFGFNVHDSFLYDIDQTVSVIVRYFDEGNGKFTIQYDSTDAPLKEGEAVQLTGSNTWKEYAFVLHHAKFTGRSNGDDFLIGVYGLKMGIGASDLIILFPMQLCM